MPRTPLLGLSAAVATASPRLRLCLPIRNRECELRALVHLSVRPDPSPMPSNNSLHRHKPNPRPWKFARRVKPLKWVEQQIDVLRIESHTADTNKIDHFLAFAPESNLNLRVLPFRCVLPCIPQQVLEHRIAWKAPERKQFRCHCRPQPISSRRTTTRMPPASKHTVVDRGMQAPGRRKCSGRFL